MSQIPAELVAAVSRGGNDGEALRIAVNDVLTLCAEVLLLLMRRVSLWGPEDGEVYKTEIGTAGWVSQVLSVMDRVEHLFIPQDTGEGCVYLHSSREVRRQWNDLWFHCPFGTGTARSAASVMECVCGADVGADERAYFLNLLFERRAMMSPGAFVDLVMTGVEVYLEQLEGVYEDWIIDVNTEPSGDTVVEDDESVLVRFSDEYLWPSAGNLEREDGGRRRYLGGFLSQATHILIAGSSYPHSAGLLRLVGPRLMTLLLPSDEDDSEEGHETADNMGVTTLLRVALVTTFTGELLSYWPKDFPSGSGNAGGTDTTALTTSVRELINMAAVDVCKFVSDNHSHSVSAAATRVGLQQLSEGVKQNVVEPVLALLCAEWRLPDGTDVWFFGEVLEEIGRTVVMAGDCKASTQSLSAVYDIVRYFDSLEILDYSRRQAVIAITRRVYSNSKSESIRELLTGIEQYLTSR
ncbi:unnamed protein product [Symbiodinium microadriaticum]|nr:unnamed protein product [Symbiodinium microadriaticum]